jgi:hypothetical protein
MLEAEHQNFYEVTLKIPSLKEQIQRAEEMLADAKAVGNKREADGWSKIVAHLKKLKNTK